MSQEDKMKILLLSFRLPYPLTEGFKLRAYHLAQILAREHEVDLLTLHHGPIPTEHRAHLEKVFTRVICFSHPPIPARLRALLMVPSSAPLQVGYYRSRRVQQWIAAHWAEYDLIFCLHLRMAQYVEGIPVPKVIDLIDAASLFYREAQEYSSGLWHWIYRTEAPRVLAYEARLFRIFDRVFVASPYDAEVLQRSLPKVAVKERLIVLPNGVREELLRRSCSEERNRLVFLGKMDYGPNVDAVIFFARRIFSALRRQDPTLAFSIVGTSPRSEVQDLKNLPGVEVTGYVEDPFSIVERSRLVVAPLRYGAGIQNKVLEAMALGKAVLTTPCGARGIAGRDGEHFRIVRDERLWPAEITRLLENRQMRQALGERARRLIEERYRWDGVGERLLQELDGLIPQGVLK